MDLEQRLQIFFEKGYKIDLKGNVINPLGEFVKGYIEISKKGYRRKRVGIRIEGSKVNLYVHKLQAYNKFSSKMFEKNLEVRHLNGDSTDNSWENIELGTTSQNAMDKPKEVRIRVSILATRKMQDNTRSYEERCKIYDDLKSGKTYSEIMEKHNISSKGTLSFMKNKSIEYKEYKQK